MKATTNDRYTGSRRRTTGDFESEEDSDNNSNPLAVAGWVKRRVTRPVTAA